MFVIRMSKQHAGDTIHVFYKSLSDYGPEIVQNAKDAKRFNLGDAEIVIKYLDCLGIVAEAVTQ